MEMQFLVTGEGLQRDIESDGEERYSREFEPADKIRLWCFDGFQQLHFTLDWSERARSQVSGWIHSPIVETFLFRGTLEELKELIKKCGKAQQVLHDPRMVV